MSYLGQQPAVNIGDQSLQIPNRSIGPEKLTVGTLNWTADGNVGIGTATPTSIGGFTALMVNAAGAGNPLIDLAKSNTVYGRLSADTTGLNVESAKIAFFTSASGVGAGAERLRIDANGNVGIGTTNPDKKLTVAGEIKTTVGLRFPDGTLQTTAGAGFSDFALSATSPGPLNFSASSLSGFYAYDSADFPSRYYVGLTVRSSSTPAAQLAMHWDTEEAAPTKIHFRTNDDTGNTSAWSPWTKILTEKDIFVDSVGRVGIGTTAPTATLDIVSTLATGTALQISSAANLGYGIIQFGKSPTATNNWHLVSEGDGSFRFYNGNPGAGSEKLRIDVNGNVGIGVIAPAGKLDVAGDIILGAPIVGGGAQQLVFRGGNTDYAKIRFETAGDAAGQSGLVFETWDNANEPFVFRQSEQERMRIDTAGNVGIGTQYPGQKLTVAGAVESTSGGFKFPDGSVQTTAFSAAAAGGIGVGQTWQQVSRAIETTYTNTTGKPIMLVATAGRNGVSTAGFMISINGLAIALCMNTNSGGGNRSVGSIIIPPNATYRLIVSGWSEPLSDYTIWELR